MKWNRRLAPVVAGCFAAAMLVASCGKSEKTSEEKTPSALERIAKQASQQKQVSESEIADVAKMLEGAGYKETYYGDFPTEGIGKQEGRIMVYTDSNGKQSGGVVYMKRSGMDVEPVWHWYFPNVVPEKVEKVELNGDGLWDLRVTTKDGKTMDFLQDQSFVLSADARTDWIAMNGESSPPLDDNGLWRCFDSDTSTAWRSSRGKSGGAFVELNAPFGLQKETLEVRTLGSDQPHHVTLYADGQKVKEFDLDSKAAKQKVSLGDGVKGAKKLRMTFDSTYGNGDVVSVAELGFM